MCKIREILVVGLLFLPLFILGCNHSLPTIEHKDERVKVLSTIAQIGDLVSEVGGNRVQSIVLVRGELNPHSYELVKGDDEKIQSAAMIFYNGLGLEHGASVSAMIAAHPNHTALAESIHAKHPNKILWQGSTPDPHIWMDVSLWKETIDPITAQLIQKDPEGTSYYLERAEILKKKMDEADLQIYRLIQSIPENRRYLVTSHDAFHYFTRRYLASPGESNWSKRFAAPEGLSPDGQLNPIDLQKIIDHLYTYHIEVLFPESNVSRDSIRKIADAGKKLKIDLCICREVLYGDSLKGSYIEAMMHNAKVISDHLKKGEAP
jgi:manganese/zinc/iron transport system substrate-binding protein